MINKIAQAQNPIEIAPTANQVAASRALNTIIQKQPLLKTNGAKLLNLFRQLRGNSQYVVDNGNLLIRYERKILELQKLLQFQPIEVDRIAILPTLPEPSDDDENFKKQYQTFIDFFSQFSEMISQIIPNITQYIQLTKNSFPEPWAMNLQVILYKDIFVNLYNLCRQINLIKRPEITAAQKIAYPQIQGDHNIDSNVDIKKWKEIAAQIDSFNKVYGKEYTFAQILYHFTSDWNMFDRFKFKKWYLWNKKNASKTGENQMIKQGKDFITDNKISQFEAKRKLLISRINLIRKALNDMISNRLINKEVGGKLFRIISVLEHETLNIEMPKLAVARLKRHCNQMEKLGFVNGANQLKQAIESIKDENFCKIAQQQNKVQNDNQKVVQLLQKIKQELDMLSYSRHLDTLFDVKKQLEEIGRQNDAEMVMKIIKDDLDGVDKLNKKLIDVYTALSRIPLELTSDQIEDKQNIEVREDEIEPVSEVAKIEKEPSSRQVVMPPSLPRAKSLTPPKINREIPNV